MTRETPANRQGVQQHAGRRKKEAKVKDGAAAAPGPKKGSSPFLAPPMAPPKPKPQPLPVLVRREAPTPLGPSRAQTIYTAKPRPVTGRNSGAAAGTTAAGRAAAVAEPAADVTKDQQATGKEHEAELGTLAEPPAPGLEPASVGTGSLQQPQEASEEPDSAQPHSDQPDSAQISTQPEAAAVQAQSVAAVVRPPTEPVSETVEALKNSTTQDNTAPGSEATANDSSGPPPVPPASGRSQLPRPHAASTGTALGSQPQVQPSSSAAPRHHSPSVPGPHHRAFPAISPIRTYAHSSSGAGLESPVAAPAKSGKLSHLGAPDKPGQTGQGKADRPSAAAVIRRPSLALCDRAVHLYFLQELEAMEVEVPDDDVSAGDEGLHSFITVMLKQPCQSGWRAEVFRQ